MWNWVTCGSASSERCWGSSGRAQSQVLLWALTLLSGLYPLGVWKPRGREAAEHLWGEPFNIKTTKSGHPPSMFFCPLIHMTPGIPYSLKYFPLRESPQYWVKIQSQMVHNSEEANRSCTIYERPGKSYFCNKQCLNNTLATGFLLFNDQTVEVYNYHGFLSI